MAETEQLEQAGLTRNEAKVFLALLELGISTSGNIIKKTGLHASKVYDSLERLQKKGLASYVVKAGRKHFSASSPEKLLKLEKEKERMISRLVPSLQELRKKEVRRIKIEVYEGKEGLKTIIQDILRYKEHDTLASGGGFARTFPYFSDVLSSQIKKKKIKARAIRPLTAETAKEKLVEGYSYRFIPSQFSVPASVVLYNQKTVIILWDKEQPTAILIENDAVNKSYRNYFEALWKIGEKS